MLTLLTYPIIFSLNNQGNHHEAAEITTSQLNEAQSAIYMHGKDLIPLGKIKSNLWPFKPAIDYITSENNKEKIDRIITTWVSAKNAYDKKDRDNQIYYLTNASGHPPQIAKTRDGWPQKESISDSKTSAGMDRTDDIKKGIYQVLKIGAKHATDMNVRTAIISNLPAYRHGEEYVDPFLDILWGSERNLEEISGKLVLQRQKLKWIFDYIITLEDSVLRGLSDD